MSQETETKSESTQQITDTNDNSQYVLKSRKSNELFPIEENKTFSTPTKNESQQLNEIDNESPLQSHLLNIKKKNKNNNELPYIASFSIHGLVRGRSPELGRDLDTGGQVMYVLEHAIACGKYAQVDLFTRYINDPEVSEDYSVEKEMLGNNPNVNIIRIKCGNSKYIKKELLWPYIDEYADRVLQFILKYRRKPTIVHGHYADGCLVACKLADILGVPMAMTGHSMGRTKLRSLMTQKKNNTRIGKNSYISFNDNNLRKKYKKIKRIFKIDVRIEAEERSLMSTNLVIANSKEEIKSQWKLLYDGFVSYEELWKSYPLKPGVGMKRFIWKHKNYKCTTDSNKENEQIINHESIEWPDPNDTDSESDSDDDDDNDNKNNNNIKKINYPIMWKKIERQLKKPNKPCVLLLARPAPEKNLHTMVEVFGEFKEVRKKCNLVIISGNRKNKLTSGQKAVWDKIRNLIDKYSLHGRVSYPEEHNRSDVPSIFAYAAYRKGLFANIALREPFGLTLVEASLNGAPILATREGAGPEIVNTLKNGIHVDVKKKQEIANGILDIISSDNKWYEYHKNSLLKSPMYSWNGHVETYIKLLPEVQINKQISEDIPSLYECKTNEFDLKLSKNDIIVICDIDNTLLGPKTNESAMNGFKKLVNILNKNKNIKLAVATGRSINSCVEYLNTFDNKLVSQILFFITSVGTEIHFYKTKQFQSSKGDLFNVSDLVSDKYYNAHISYRWSKQEIIEFIDTTCPELIFQGKETGHGSIEQRSHKVSYCYREEKISYDDDDENDTINIDPNKTHKLSDSNVYIDDNNFEDDIESKSSHEDSTTSSDSSPDKVNIQEYGFGTISATRNLSNLAELKHGLRGTLKSSNSLANLSKMQSFSNIPIQYFKKRMNLKSSWGANSSDTGSYSDNSDIPKNTKETREFLLKVKQERKQWNSYLHDVSIDESKLKHLNNKQRKEQKRSDEVKQFELLLKSLLRQQGFVCEVIFSHNKYVDIIPIRSGKGKAIRYLIARHDLSFDQIVTCGDSGNDFDMLTGLTKSIVVKNCTKELYQRLKSLKLSDEYLYFAQNEFANGIIEGLKHYKIIG